MRKEKDHGFLISFLVNLAFRFEWLLLAGILWLLHVFHILPWWVALIPIGIWVLHALLVTLVLFGANRLGSAPSPVTKNVNPYSKKNSDYNYLSKGEQENGNE